jgi:hypothetical protein
MTTRDAVETILSDDAESFFRQNYRYGTWDGEEFAQDQDWTGFGFVLGGDGEPIAVPGEYLTGHQCAHLLDVSNADEATRLIREAAGRDACEEWNGFLVYDYGDENARHAAERISQRLAGYPVLNDEDFSERERTNALKVLADSYDIPENIAGDVLREIEERGDSLCTDCNSWKDIDEIMADLGYRQCQDCDEWLETSHEKPLCYDCAETYAEGECECVPVMVDGYRHGGHTVTVADVQETLRGCETCYPLVYPHGR